MREHNYDVVLLDLVLPVLNEIEGLKELELAKAVGSHVPVAFGMSNVAEPEDIALATAHGLHAFVNKPVDVADVCAVICRLFKKTQARSGDVPASPVERDSGISSFFCTNIFAKSTSSAISISTIDGTRPQTS
jgi:DNA-binding response OmpR family regulator